MSLFDIATAVTLSLCLLVSLACGSLSLSVKVFYSIYLPIGQTPNGSQRSCLSADTTPAFVSHILLEASFCSTAANVRQASEGYIAMAVVRSHYPVSGVLAC